jgi:hypothetical protein
MGIMTKSILIPHDRYEHNTAAHCVLKLVPKSTSPYGYVDSGKGIHFRRK